MTTFPTTEITFLLPGPAGNLELLVTPALTPIQPQTIAIICHPHPLFGGTMHNKVVSTLARAFKNLNLHTVRFNFRGIGKSEGSFAEGVGELADLLAVVTWVKQVAPEAELVLAGFSFGGYISAKAATQLPGQVKQLVSIAPQASRFTEEAFPPITCPWLIIQGEEDEVVSPDEVYAWVATLNPQPRLIRMAGAGHFFHGKLTELREVLEKNLIF